MSLLLFFNLVISILGFVLISIIAIRVFRAWLKYREEALIHLTLIFCYIALLVVLYEVALFLNQGITLGKGELALISVFYCIFYLEFAFFYLSLFPNRSNIFEKYIPVIMSISITLNAIIVLLNETKVIDLAILLTSIVVFLGLYLVFQSYRRFKNTEKYFGENEDHCDRNFTINVKNILIFIFVLFFFDGLGFIGLFAMNIVVDDIVLTISIIVIFFSTILTFILSYILHNKAKGCDITLIFNTLS